MEDLRFLMPDGSPVEVGQRFTNPTRPGVFEVWSLDGLFVYLRAIDVPRGPAVVKRWKFADKGWVRKVD